MALINTQIQPFTAQAFKDGKFIEVSEKDIEGKWAVFVFYPADFTFVCPTELGDVADHYEELQSRGVEIFSVSKLMTTFCEINSLAVGRNRYRIQKSIRMMVTLRPVRW